MIFRDMVQQDLQRRGSRRPTVLDIGCGRGFDDDVKLQASLAACAERYIGVEPDVDADLAAHFSETHRCLFEDAPIAPGSVDLAFAVMVQYGGSGGAVAGRAATKILTACIEHGHIKPPARR